MREEFIGPAATIAGALIQKSDNKELTSEQIADLFRSAYEGLEKAEEAIANRQGNPRSFWDKDDPSA